VEFVAFGLQAQRSPKQDVFSVSFAHLVHESTYLKQIRGLLRKFLKYIFSCGTIRTSPTFRALANIINTSSVPRTPNSAIFRVRNRAKSIGIRALENSSHSRN